MVSDRIKHRPLYEYIFWSRASIKSPPDFQHNRRMNWRGRRNERIKRKTALIRKTITLNLLAHFLEILCRHRTTNAVKIDQNCNAIAHLINLYDRRFIKHLATIATSISSKIPKKRELSPKNWKKKKKKKEIYHEYPFRWGAWLWTFYQQFWYLKLMYPTHLRRKEKRKIKTLLVW